MRLRHLSRIAAARYASAMKPDLSAQAIALADSISQPQAEAMLILHETQGTRHRGSGVQWNTFSSLDRLGLAYETLDGFWYLTELGGVTQRVMRDLMEG